MKCELIIDEFFCNKDPKRHLIELDRSSIEYIPATYSFGTTNPQVYIDQSFSLTITGFKFRFKNLKLADDEYGLFLTNDVYIQFNYGKSWDDPVFQFADSVRAFRKYLARGDSGFHLTLWLPLEKHKNSVIWVHHILPKLFKGASK